VCLFLLQTRLKHFSLQEEFSETLKHFIIQKMNKYIIRRYITIIIKYSKYLKLLQDGTITVILAKQFTELPDDGSLVIRNILEQF